MPLSVVKVIFENDSFVVAFKESGWLSVPSRFENDDKRPVCGRLLEGQLNARLWPCHRLDFEVSGLQLFAKSPQAHRSANAWFETHAIRKTYQALCSESKSVRPLKIENITLETGKKYEWSCLLAKGKKRAFEAPHGKKSMTIASYFGQSPNNFESWELEPVTGRSHQLRFEMARHGRPILGDVLYGSQTEWHNSSAIALQSTALNLVKIEANKRFGVPNLIELPKEYRLF